MFLSAGPLMSFNEKRVKNIMLFIYFFAQKYYVVYEDGKKPLIMRW